VQMLRQDEDGVDSEGMVVARLPEGGAQVADIPDQLIIAPALGKSHGEEILCAGKPDAFIGSHQQSLDELRWLRYFCNPKL
jgi:hypothetical protein